MKSRFVKICVLLLCSVFAVATFAQNANSTITGTVQDVSGAVVPGATIDLTNVGTGQQLSIKSQGNGFYSFVDLSPANYKISVTAQGFAQWVGVLTLRVSQAAQVNPRMTAASVTTQVVVRDVTPVIDQVNGMMSDVKEATRIETIPLQNRNVLNILNFSPGVVANGFAGQGGVSSSGPGWTRINGMPGGSLDYLIDGQTAQSRYTGELESNPQPIPTLQELKVMTSNGNAQYSRPGIVEMVTKSGTNHFHGQLFELNQNNVLRAKTYRQININYLNHNEFGGQLGGPVWLPKLYNGRNKTFFFVDLEGIRTDSFAQALSKIPTKQWQTGDLSTLVDTLGSPIKIYDPLTTTLNPVTGAYTRTQISYNGAANVIPPNRINPVSAKVMSYMPTPNIDIPYWKGPNYSVPAAADTFRNKLYTAKVDQLFGPNRLAMRYNYTSSNELSPVGSGYLLTNGLNSSGVHNGAVVFTQVLGPRAVNIVRAGVNYSHNFVGPEPTPGIENQLGLPTYSGSQSWPEIDWFGGFAFIVSNNPKDYPGSTITFGDQFSYNRGNHQFMFGFDLQNYRVNTYNYVQPGGAYYFNGNFSALQDPSKVAKGTYDAAAPDTGSGFADLLMGNLDLVRLSVYPHFHSQQTEFAGFAQDDWRVTERLTLNLGVRYTYWTPFEDAKGIGSNFDPNIPGGMVVYQGSGALPSQTSQTVYDKFVNAGLPIESAAKAGFPTSLWNMPKNTWDPRFGFAYQLDSKSVLRGGWGMYHWAMPLDFWLNVSHSNPPFSYRLQYTADVNGDPSAAQLEFPIASAKYGGPLPADAFQWGETVNGQPGPTVLNTNVLNISQSGGWPVMPLDPNYKPQMVQEYNLSFARELPGHFGAQISYVGNRTRNQPMEDPYNYTIPRELAPPGATPPQRRAFPNFATSAYNTMAALKYIGYSNDNQLNAQLTRSFGSGLTVQAAYIWSRTLSTSAINEGSYVPQAANLEPASLTPGYTLSNYLSGASESERLRVDYGPDSQLPFHTLNINGHYELPFGRGKRFLSNSSGLVNRLVSGYNISPFFYWRSGLHFAPYFSAEGSAIMLAPGKHGGELPESQRKPSRWFDPSVAREDLGKPYTGQAFIERANTLDNDFRNNSPQNYMTGPGFNELDASVYKLTPIAKGSVLDIEAQIFNVYNHMNWGMPNTQGVISSGIGQPRLIQLQAKYVF